MKRNRLLVLITLLLALSSIAFAQSKRVSGVISDKATGELLPGVNIMEKGTSKGTVTDIDGKYSLEVADNAVLTISFIGYVEQNIPVTGKSSINASLEADFISLGEVVAVGYGTVKKKDITGSVSSIAAKDLMKAPVSSLDAGLQGKMAGVTVQQTSGAPGAKMKIRVRGGGSVNYSNEPLYVIDGFIGADITTVNPSDIATIDVLKDASATAVYGSRGANGVVLITTNAPKQGAMVVSYDGNVGVSNTIDKYEILSAGEMALAWNDRQALASNPIPFSDADILGFNEKGGTDWQDLVTRQGIKQNHTINMNGGSEKIQYYFSANYLDDQGVVEESFYKRGSLRSNISVEVFKWLNMKFNTYGTSNNTQNNWASSNGAYNIMGRAVTYPQIWGNKDENGEYLDPHAYTSYGIFDVGKTNPEQWNLQNQETMYESIISNLDLTFDLPLNFTFTTSIAGRFASSYNGRRDLLSPENTRESLTAKNQWSRSNGLTTTNVLTYEKDFGKHSLKASGVYEFQKSDWRDINASTNNLATLGNEWLVLQNGNMNGINTRYSESQMRSYMGRFNYAFADKYLLTASLRADQSSLFRPGNQWGYFPSAALAWRASEEGFIKNLTWIHNLKVRAGYGEVGNTAIDYAGTKQGLINYQDDWYKYLYSAMRVDKTLPIKVAETGAVVPGSLTDPDISWETTTQSNIGIDFAVLGGRLSTVIDFYKKRTTDVIIDTSLPIYAGQAGNSFRDNFGTIDNTGFEIAVNYTILDKTDWKWDASVNLSHNKNNVVDIDGKSNEIFLASEADQGMYGITGGNKFIVRKGESMGSFYGLESDGLWQVGQEAEAAKYNSKVGEIKYLDKNNDGAITAEDRDIVGNAAPDFNYGIGTSVSYKNVDLSIQCVGTVGNDIYNYSRYAMDANMLNPDYKNRWTPENPGAEQATYIVGTDYNKSYITDYYLESGSFFKISNINLGYNLPKQWVNKLKVGSIRLYGSVNNILTITAYKGLDPEGSTTSLTSDAEAGIDAFAYPSVRTFTGGLKVVF